LDLCQKPNADHDAVFRKVPCGALTAMARLLKILSGGQRGVDQTALQAAIDCGLECGGWCPPDRQDEEGPIPAEFPLQPTPYEISLRAPEVRRFQRTEWNVFCSGATLIFHVPEHDGGDPGTLWTAKCAARFKRPCLRCDPRRPTATPEIIRWLADIEKEQGGRSDGSTSRARASGSSQRQSEIANTTVS
jgi:Circularly permutated YpsA SLOG family